jgi:hypothetical protein
MNNNNITYTPLSISTITICFNFNQTFSLGILKEKLNNDVVIKFNPGSKKSKNPKKKGTDFFYNSFDIRLKIFHKGIIVNISVFIFPNSKVKIAGIKSIEMIDIIIDQLIEIISEYLPFENELKAENIKIQMICSDFKVKPIKENNSGWCIKQDLLKKILVNNYNTSATFSPLSRYPGINVKKKSLIENNKPVSLLIFRSGSIIITGAKDIIDINDSYNFIVNVIRNYSSELFYYDINEEIKQQKKNKKNII